MNGVATAEPLVGVAITETSPVGVPAPEATLIVTLIVWPVEAVDGTPVNVVVVELNEAVFHFVTRLLTFADPRPVALSYPVPAAYRGLPVP